MRSRQVQLGFVSTLVLSLCAMPAASQGPLQITPDVVYGHKDGMALTFDVFRPLDGANGAGVLFMVSGGWVSRWRPPEEAVDGFRFLLDQGFTVFAVRHGSSPRYLVPDAVSDVKLATRYINLHAREYGVDPSRLGAWGGSAGGHLSLMLGFTDDLGDPAGADAVAQAPSDIAAVVAYFPPTDLRTMVGPSRSFPALDFDPALAEGISPIAHVTPDAPPTLLIHGDADRLVNLSYSTRLLPVLEAAGVTAELIVIPGAGHGFEGAETEQAQQALVEWFRTHLVP